VHHNNCLGENYAHIPTQKPINYGHVKRYAYGRSHVCLRSRLTCLSNTTQTLFSCVWP